MGKKKQHKTVQMLNKQKKEEVELFTVHSKADGKQVYIGDGIEKEVAEQLSENLLQPTFIQLVE